LTVVPGNTARVVINERTGTIVFGSDVKLSKVAITHGNLIISTAETPEVSQPNAFSEGETTVVPRTSVDVMEQPGVISVLEENVTVGDLASSLNALGVSPRDLSSIFQTLKESGALHAELELK
jgi:flagellar P-ring protein precursor FlgI